MANTNSWRNYLLSIFLVLLMALAHRAWSAQDAVNAAVARHGEEIARMNAEYAAIMRELQTMNKKLDKLIEKNYSE